MAETSIGTKERRARPEGEQTPSLGEALIDEWQKVPGMWNLPADIVLFQNALAHLTELPKLVN